MKGNSAVGDQLRTRVHAPNGRSIADARVFVTSSLEPVADIAALSNDSGEVVLSVPSEGSYTIACSARGLLQFKSVRPLSLTPNLHFLPPAAFHVW